jgi:hypothetical protein
MVWRDRAQLCGNCGAVRTPTTDELAERAEAEERQQKRRDEARRIAGEIVRDFQYANERMSLLAKPLADLRGAIAAAILKGAIAAAILKGVS